MSRRSRQTSPLLRVIPIVLGLTALAGTLIAAAIHGSFLSAHYATFVASLLAIAGGIVWLTEVKWREFLLSFVYTLFFILCISQVYLISANRRERFDLTADQIHSLNPQTEAVLEAIPTDQRIVANVFAPTQEHDLMERFLDAYSRVTPKFDYRLYDAGRDLDVVQQFGGAVDENAIYLVVEDSSGSVTRKAPPEVIPIGNIQRESLLTNAIARLITEPDKKFYYILGHGERRVDEKPDSLSRMVRLINDSTMPVEPLRLSEGRIPENASGLIMAGPKQDIEPFERDLLIDYLDNGGKLLLMIDPEYGRGVYMPNVAEVLATMGLSVPNAFVVDPQSVNTQRTAFAPVANWAQHPITEGTGNVPFYLFNARPIQNTDEPPDGVELKAILYADDRCWIELAAELRSMSRPVPPENKEDIGNQILAVSARRATKEGRWGETMRAVVIGDSNAFTDEIISRNGEAGLFAVQSMNWLRERDDLLVIPPRLLTSTPIVLTSQRVWIILGSFLLIGLVITIGGTTRALLRRRLR